LEHTKEREQLRRYYELELFRHEHPMFSLSWTLIHIIDETSAFRDMTNLARYLNVPPAPGGRQNFWSDRPTARARRTTPASPPAAEQRLEREEVGGRR
jgi:hypothetical protein